MDSEDLSPDRLALQRAVLKAIPDLVWLKDPDGLYLACNRRFEQFYGQPESGILGRSDRDFVSPELADFFRQHDLAAMQGDGPRINEEVVTFASDGHQELLQTIKTALRRPDGSVLGVLGIGRDITALRRVEQEYRALFAHNPAPMLVYERDTLALVEVNEAFLQLYGHQAGDIAALRLPDLYAPWERERLVALTRTISGLVNTGEWHQQRKDGSPVVVVSRSHDIVHEGRACRVAVMTDVTRLHRAARRDRSRLRLLENLARGEALTPLLDQLARDHEALFPRSRCRVELLDEDTPRTGADAPWTEAGPPRRCAVPITGAQGRLLGHITVEPGDAGPDEEEFEHLSFSAQLAATAITQWTTTQRLHRSERQLRDILHAIPDLVWLKDRDGVIRSCNTAFAQLVGRPAGDILGRRPADLLDPDTACALDQGDEAVFDGAPLHGSELWLGGADGRRGLFETIRAPLHDDRGARVGVLGVARDITLLRQGARAMAEQERLIDSMFSQTTDSIVLLEPDTLDFVTFNEAAWRGLGYTKEAFATLRPTDLQLDLDETEVREAVQQVCAGASLSLETRHRRADGGVQHAALTLRMLSYSGRPLVSAVWRDITESRRHEARIHRLNQAYAVLSGVNEAIVRLRDPDRLHAEVCRIVVEIGGFRMAWIGQVEDDAIVPLVHAGHADGYLDRLRLPLHDERPGPTAQALLSGAPAIINDIAADLRMKPWREAALRHGYRASAAFPVVVGERARCVLSVYAGSAGHFDTEQIALYTRLAQDVGFALELRGAEAATRQEQRLREQMMESVAGLFFVLDRRGRVMMWNRRLEEVTGYSGDELRDRVAVDYFDPGERALIAARVQDVLERGEAQAEASLVSRDGRRTPYLFVSRRVDLDEPLIVGTGIDISERVRTERELAGYRQHLEELVATRTAELEQVNARLNREDRRLRAMLSLSQKASTLGESDLLRFGLDEALRLSGSRAGCLHDGGAGGATPALLACSGCSPGLREELLASRAGIAVPIVEDETLRFVLCATGRDGPYDDSDRRELELVGSDLWRIIRRRRTELALEQAKAAADAASQAKSAFLANMSHEIRTPMNAIIGFAHLLGRDPLTPRQHEHLGRLTDASQHLLQVINDILDFSKIDAHKIHLDTSVFDPRESIGRVAGMLRDRARAKRLTLQVRLERCPPRLVADRLRLEQVLLNLLGNAIKFTTQGRVEVRAQPVGPDPGEAGPGWLRIEVEDTGVGIAPAQRAHLFAAFEQADVSTTRRFGGTGLGLAISKRLIELMHGRIDLRSEPGAGSTFWFDLPLDGAVPAGADAPAPQRRIAPAPAAPPVPATVALRPARVLLVEDHPINQEVAAELLRTLGLTVDLADNGAQALERFVPGRHALILMDVQMPVMDGLRATAAIRRLPGGARVPIIALTASAFQDDRMQCLEAGMDDFLGKPVEPEQLRRCLMTWLGPDASPPPPARPVAPGEAGLRERLEAAGLDVDGALARMGGQLPLYRRSLRLFADHHGQDGATMRRPGIPLAELRRLAHSLAGAAGTIGAPALQHLARELELDAGTRLATGTQATDAATAAVLALADATERLCTQLHEALAPAAQPTAPGQPAHAPEPPRAAAPVDWADVRLRLEAMGPLLIEHDTALADLVEQALPVLEPALGELARQLAEQIGSFSFEAAQQTWSEALQHAREAAPT
ncbi:PAS domain S-box protein [Sphaerotilus uruguayifluvii]|uniref:histidine kinase n=1 Tax=Sphaerotilus uruguayifluvii TaxID=2735897 RepID=A0ABX2G104_9BURK|nr:PAS domain S-box protein [Leptothrix sp. C29]NRT55720.1 PAS domain S-box-containing protein [Leptothrix sp. C29]